MNILFSRPVLITAFIAITCSISLAQSSLSLSSATTSPGSTVTLNLNLTSPTGSSPSSLQWTLSYPTAAVTSISVLAGPALTSASKSITCSASSGSYVCLAAGMNNGGISNGIVATVTVTMSATAGTTTIGVTNAKGASSAALGVSVTATGGVITVASPLTISTLGCTPNSVGPGSSSVCTVGLSGTAGSSVTLASNNTSLTVPASVTVAAGATTATFSATAVATFVSNQTATVTATLGSSSKTATVNLVAPVLVSGVACNPTSLAPSAVSTCTVTLSQTATSGSSVTLASNNTSLTVPVSVTIAAGASTANFNATAAATFTSNQSATVTATLGGSSKTAVINGATTGTTTPAFIQETDNQVTSGNISSATFSSPPAAGHLIAVYLIWDNAGSASVSDSLGNKYASAVGPTRWSNSKYSVQIFYAINLVGGPDTVAATFATAVKSFGIVYAHEYSGVASDIASRCDGCSSR